MLNITQLGFVNMSNNLIEPDGSHLQKVPSQHLGPEYRPLDEKPEATVSTSVPQENVHVLAQTPQLIALLT